MICGQCTQSPLGGPTDCTPPGSPVHRVSQARRLEWVAISFSRGLPDMEMEPASPESPALAGRFFTTEPPGKPQALFRCRGLPTHPERVPHGRARVCTSSHGLPPPPAGPSPAALCGQHKGGLVTPPVAQRPTETAAPLGLLSLIALLRGRRDTHSR